jgi:hypothetical protein
MYDDVQKGLPLTRPQAADAVALAAESGRQQDNSKMEKIRVNDGAARRGCLSAAVHVMELSHRLPRTEWRLVPSGIRNIYIDPCTCPSLNIFAVYMGSEQPLARLPM